MLRVLLVDSDEQRAGAVRAMLEAQGYKVVGVTGQALDLTAQVRASAADVIVCGLEDPSRDALDSMRALHRDEPRPVVLFAERGEPEQIEAAIEAGVAAYMVEGLAPARVRPVVEVAIRQFRAQQALRAELQRTQAELGERKIIERAKGLLMQRHHLGEPEAHATLRRLAMDRGQKMAEAAAWVIAQKDAKKRI
ncbi:ANTAR domain-containing protein [Roseomonas sp. GC11]|uniref:ANTAR domain-containing response regulator n=1 Tax=Roseomonas sp. GC11 TaxID=2950546 RepID=UPI00210929AD|nr:ANTAR domain-containing protein [Roseomonas sp. GC11]MCQ4161538.1 ANTAR domain-containing protein [Roseomonas sp. GC11]